MEDSGLQIITLWGPTIGHFENINFEILDLPPPKGSKTRVHGGGCIYIYIYIHILMWIKALSTMAHMFLPLCFFPPRPVFGASFFEVRTQKRTNGTSLSLGMRDAARRVVREWSGLGGGTPRPFFPLWNLPKVHGWGEGGARREGLLKGLRAYLGFQPS